jgi:hypothetical protein
MPSREIICSEIISRNYPLFFAALFSPILFSLLLFFSSTASAQSSACIEKESELKSVCAGANVQSCSPQLKDFCCSCETTWQTQFALCAGGAIRTPFPTPTKRQLRAFPTDALPTPTFTPTNTSTPTNTPTRTATPTATPIPPTPTPLPPGFPTPVPTIAPTSANLVTPVPTEPTTNEVGGCVSGVDCFLEKLLPSACGEVNGFLKQQNTATVVNSQNEPLQVTIQYRDQDGVLKHESTAELASLERRDYDINKLGLVANRYGTVCIITTAKTNGAWFGGIIQYKNNQRARTRGASRAAREQFDFVQYYPFTNVIKTPSSIPINTNHYGTDKRAEISNWIRISDGKAGDGVQLAGTLTFYDQKGKVVKTTAVNIPDGGRFDLSGHEAIGTRKNKDAIGSARFVPNSNSEGYLPYYLTVGRYFYDCPGATCDNFVTGFSVPIRRSTDLELTNIIEYNRNPKSAVIAKTMLELNNNLNSSIPGKMQLFNLLGKKLGQASWNLAPYSSRVMELGTLKSVAKEKGPRSALSLSSQSANSTQIFYYYNNKGRLLYAFSAPPLNSSGKRILLQLNSQLKQTNQLMLNNVSAKNVSIQLKAINFDGTQLLTKSLTIPAKGSTTYRASLPKDKYGLFVIEADGEGIVARNIVSKGNEYAIVYNPEQ